MKTTNDSCLTRGGPLPHDAPHISVCIHPARTSIDALSALCYWIIKISKAQSTNQRPRTRRTSRRHFDMGIGFAPTGSVGISSGLACTTSDEKGTQCKYTFSKAIRRQGHSRWTLSKPISKGVFSLPPTSAGTTGWPIGVPFRLFQTVHRHRRLHRPPCRRYPQRHLNHLRHRHSPWYLPLRR